MEDIGILTKSPDAPSSVEGCGSRFGLWLALLSIQDFRVGLSAVWVMF